MDLSRKQFAPTFNSNGFIVVCIGACLKIQTLAFKAWLGLEKGGEGSRFIVARVSLFRFSESVLPDKVKFRAMEMS